MIQCTFLEAHPGNDAVGWRQGVWGRGCNRLFRERVAAWSGEAEGRGRTGQESRCIRWRKKLQDLLWKEGEGSAEKFPPSLTFFGCSQDLLHNLQEQCKMQTCCLTRIRNFKTGTSGMRGLAEHGALWPHPVCA